MPALHTLIQEMNEKHDDAIDKITGPLMAAIAAMGDVRYNYTGEDEEQKQFYRDIESNLEHYLEAFTYYVNRGTFELPNYEGE